MNEDILQFVSRKADSKPAHWPQITLSYAQSVDGSISVERGKTTPISGPESLKLTHQLRAIHAGILVGIGTILADDPQLSVREVEGKNPQALILDSRLRFPIDSKLLQQSRKPWIFYAEEKKQAQDRRKVLEEAGAKVFPVAADAKGGIDLKNFLQKVHDLGLQNIMVEGGATLLTSFLLSRLAHKTVITIAPVFIGGLKVIDKMLIDHDQMNFPRILKANSSMLGNDIILWGDLS